nr:hypothetical protein [Tanacetum cinerariifolium]
TFDDNSFDSEGEKIKEAEFLIDPLDLPCDILSKYDSFNSQDFSRDDVLFSPDNEDKVFNPGILSHEKSVKIITRVIQKKKLAIPFASWLFEDFDPLFSELLVFKEVPNSMRLLPFSFENEEKVFKPGIYTFKKFHCCSLSELSHPETRRLFVCFVLISCPSGVENLILIPSESEGIPEHVCDVPSHDNSPPLDVSKDQIEDFFESIKEFSSIDDDSFSIDDIDYVEASPPDFELVSSEVMEIVIPKVGRIDDDILLTINHDVLREKLRNVNLLISKIEALNANPTPSFDCKTKSSSTSLTSLLKETNTFDNSLPEFETFCFDVEEISSGSTTTHPDISLPEYEALHDDHVKEISSGSLTTHFDSSLYASFMFDLSINPFPPADRSDSYEFTDELIPFISAPEYDCFRFTIEPNSRDFIKDVVEDISPTKEPQVLNTLHTYPTLQLNMKFQPSNESLFAYVVWIFLPFLVYSVVPLYLPSLRNEYIIFHPGICKYHFSRPDISHRCETIKKFNIHRSHLNKCPMLIHGQNNPLLDVLLFHFIPLESLKKNDVTALRFSRDAVMKKNILDNGLGGDL